MTTNNPREEQRSETVRKEAAKAAVAASQKTGRPVDPRVERLARD
jgi:hypothetical protein